MARDITAFQSELDRDAKRKESWGSKGGKSDFKWFTPEKPAKVGEASRQQLRILPRLTASGEPENEFWVAVDQHIMTVDGQTKVLACPDDHDSREDGVCPICALSRELYRSKEPKYLDTARELSTRRRVFVNAVNVDEIERHVSEGWTYVWAFSQTILTGLMDICVAKRAFIDDVDAGRNVMLTCKRIGPQKRDVRYSVTDMDPSAIEGSQAQVLLSNLANLDDLSSPASTEELAEVAAIMDPRPGSKRSSHIVSGNPVTAPAPVAPVPAAPAPAPAPPKPPAPEVAQPTGLVYHYNGDAGSHDPMGADKLAGIIVNNPGEHHVWAEGWSDWKSAAEVAEVAAIVAQLTAPKAASPVPPPPRSPAGPPAPPKPPGGAAF